MIVYCVWAILEIWAKSDMVEFLVDLDRGSPSFCEQIEFWLRWGEGKNLTPNLILSLSWAYPVNLVWFCSVEVEIYFQLIWGVPPLFVKKLGFGLKGGENFHPKSHSFIILGFSWKFCVIMFSRSWDIKLTAGMGWNWTGMGRGAHCDNIENLSPSFWLDLAWLWLRLRLRFVKINTKKLFRIKDSFIWDYEHTLTFCKSVEI